MTDTPDLPLADPPGQRSALERFLDSEGFRHFIIAVILVNSVVLGLQTWPAAQDNFGLLLLIVDEVTLIIYVIEIGLKLFVWRRRFFRSGWNVFDLIIVGVAAVPYSVAQNFELLRALRILRVLRLVAVVPRIRTVVEALIYAIPGMGSVIVILGLVYYVFGVMTTKLLGADFPEYFGSLGKSLFSLFQIMTLESWSSGIASPVMELHPHAWAIFIPFILVTAFGVVNLFVALIVSAMARVAAEEEHELERRIEGLSEDVRELREDIKVLTRTLDTVGRTQTPPAERPHP